MIKRISLAAICALFTILAINACKHKPYPKPGGNGTYGGFPDEIGKIMVTRCATAGCHNEATRSGGLLLDSWDHLLKAAPTGHALLLTVRNTAHCCIL